MNGAQRFLAACARQPVDRTPVWMMRQAGRYLPEYRAIRESIDFLTLCKTPKLAAEVSLQPIRRFGMDACIVFSDILIPLEAMGARVSFADTGPVIEEPIRDIAQVKALGVPIPERDAPYVLETLRLLKTTLQNETALIGFAGAPFTLASYLIEGSGSKGFTQLKQLMYTEPSTLQALLAKLTDIITEYCLAQIHAGAQAIQLFDTWAGDLTPEDYNTFAFPHQQAIVKRIRALQVPVILFVNGCAGILERMAQTAADVLSVDWRLSLASARQRLGAEIALQGNVDPAVLLSLPDVVRRSARTAMRDAGPLGHILNLGHGVLPATKLECAQAFVDAPQQAVIAG